MGNLFVRLPYVLMLEKCQVAFYNPPGNNLTCSKFQGCFRQVVGDVWRYLWMIFGDKCGTYVRGCGGDVERLLGSCRGGF